MRDGSVILRWRRLGTIVAPSASLIALLAALGWRGRDQLHRIWLEYPAALPAAVVGTTLWILAIVAVFAAERWGRRREWLTRTVARVQMDRLRRPSAVKRLMEWAPDPLEALFHPLLQTPLGRRMTAVWQQAGMGQKGSRFLLLILASALVAAWFGGRIGGVILALGLAGTVPLLPYRWIQGRAEQAVRLFSEQVPASMDSIAGGLAAGLSFQGAVAYAVEEMADPIAQALGRLDRRLRLGMPVEEAVRRLVQEHPEESLTLAAEGIILQRKLGGDLVWMLEEAAELARGRVELEREVRAVTAQGRLSGWVIAGLVPVSAGILLATNPKYIDVLFETVPGQVLLVIALLLQLIGWVVISRLIRLEY